MESFDSGAVEEAERLAQSCYVLLHDGGGSHSLLGQLDLKRDMILPNSAREILPLPPGSIAMTIPPLTVLEMTPTSAQIMPICSADPKMPNLPWLKVGKWWSQVIYTTRKSLQLKRMNLIFSMRNQDGGGHVDGHLDNETYRWLAVDVDPGMRITGTNAGPVTGAHWASMRQIAWEVDEALKRMNL